MEDEEQVVSTEYKLETYLSRYEGGRVDALLLKFV